MSRGWLLAGLRDVRRAALENPELARRVAEHPSGFLSTGLVEHCRRCGAHPPADHDADCAQLKGCPWAR